MECQTPWGHALGESVSKPAPNPGRIGMRPYETIVGRRGERLRALMAEGFGDSLLASAATFFPQSNHELNFSLAIG